MIFYPRHILAALLLHGLLFALITGGVQCSRKPEGPRVIRAVLMDPGRKQIAEQKRQDKAAEDKKKKEDEARKKKELEEAQKKAEAEKQRQAWIEKEKADKLKKQKEEEARRQKELEEKKKADEARRKKQQEDEQQDLQQAMAQEDTQRQSQREQQAQQQRDQQAETEREAKQAEWADVLANHIQKKWNRPAVQGHFPCKIHVRMLPSGDVTDAKITEGCGNPIVDRSIEEAALRSSPLPRPQDASVFDRELDIIFNPQN